MLAVIAIHTNPHTRNELKRFEDNYEIHVYSAKRGCDGSSRIAKATGSGKETMRIELVVLISLMM